MNDQHNNDNCFETVQNYQIMMSKYCKTSKEQQILTPLNAQNVKFYNITYIRKLQKNERQHKNRTSYNLLVVETGTYNPAERPLESLSLRVVCNEEILRLIPNEAMFWAAIIRKMARPRKTHKLFNPGKIIVQL